MAKHRTPAETVEELGLRGVWDSGLEGLRLHQGCKGSRVIEFHNCKVEGVRIAGSGSQVKLHDCMPAVTYFVARIAASSCR